MPDPEIKVCVVALTQKDYADIEPEDFRTLLVTPPPFCDFAVPGKPYAPAPDDWRPFVGSDTVMQFLRAANLAPISTSTYLYDPDNKISTEARDNTDLYIIDPLVLMHRVKREILCSKVQPEIRKAKTAFCIILPSNIPPGIRTKLEIACSTRLSDLFDTWLDVDVWEWEVERPQQLKKFLRWLARYLNLNGKGSTDSMGFYFEIHNEKYGTPRVLVTQTPRMSGK